MSLKAIVDQIQHEASVLMGGETENRRYTSQNQFADEATAKEAFGRSVEKLLNVNGWSELSVLTADFHLHDHAGQPKPTGSPQPGDYIQIILPGPTPENWVRVVHIALDEHRAEFAVQPSPDPREKVSDEVEHFFDEKARSTFRVERIGNTIRAAEIGTDEAINQAGHRSLVNTVIAEAGWLFYQRIQWKTLTDYLVHLP